MWIDGSTRLRYRGVRTFQAKGSHMATTKRALKAKRPKRVDRRKTTSTRITPETRARLEEGVAQSGRSLAQEIEFRLEQSFAEEKSQSFIATVAARGVYDSFGRDDIFLVARLLANAIQMIEAVTGKIWMDDPETYKQTQVACLKILDAFRPPAGARPISTDLISEGLVATESSSIGADAATNAILSFSDQATKAARHRMKKKGGVSS